MTRFVLVRDGQTEWNQVERFRGRADVPLNETGLAQATAMSERVASEWWPAAIYSSPLSRAVKTAEAVAAHCGIPVQVHPGLVDIDYGQWQGLAPEEARWRWQEEVERWYSRPQVARIPGGETLDDVRRRAMSVVKELGDGHEKHTIVLVGHMVINRIILLGVLRLGNDRFWQVRQEPCAINVFESDSGDYVLVSLNDTCHLRTRK